MLIRLVTSVSNTNLELASSLASVSTLAVLARAWYSPQGSPSARMPVSVSLTRILRNIPFSEQWLVLLVLCVCVLHVLGLILILLFY